VRIAVLATALFACAFGPKCRFSIAIRAARSFGFSFSSGRLASRELFEIEDEDDDEDEDEEEVGGEEFSYYMLKDNNR